MSTETQNARIFEILLNAIREDHPYFKERHRQMIRLRFIEDKPRKVIMSELHLLSETSFSTLAIDAVNKFQVRVEEIIKGAKEANGLSDEVDRLKFELGKALKGQALSPKYLQGKNLTIEELCDLGKINVRIYNALHAKKIRNKPMNSVFEIQKCTRDDLLRVRGLSKEDIDILEAVVFEIMGEKLSHA